MNIPFNRLDKQFQAYQAEYEAKAIEILRSGWYVLGKEVESFEKEYAKFIGSSYCVGVASGLDALILTFRALEIGVGDEVIVQANTYIASVMGITMNGATPVFIEPDSYFNMDASLIEEKVTDRTKAILVTHLYGQASNMEALVKLCCKYDLQLVEDCAQSHGATCNGVKTGNFGIGCHSFYPSKNLGAFGDAGAITTKNETLACKLKTLRNYGSQKRYHNKVVGYNSRLDELQAGLLRVKLKHFSELTAERIHVAKLYLENIKSPFVTLPQIRENSSHVWHLFVIVVEDRDHFQQFMSDRGVSTVIHYPIPPHLSEAYKGLGFSEGSFPVTEKIAQTVLSLPLYNGMAQDEIDYVCQVINEYERE